MKGRKPKPKGDPPAAEFPGKASAEIPSAPAQLDKFAQEKFKAIAAELARLGTLGAGDVYLIMMLSWALSTWFAASKQCGNQYVIYSDNGGAYGNPSLHAANTALAQVHKLCSELGLSPTSRARLLGLTGNKQEKSGVDRRKR